MVNKKHVTLRARISHGSLYYGHYVAMVATGRCKTKVGKNMLFFHAELLLRVMLLFFFVFSKAE